MNRFLWVLGAMALWGWADTHSLYAMPANDNCVNAVPLADGETLFDTRGASTDGPDEPICDFLPIDNQINQDIWFHYQASCSGELTISLCETETSANGGFDTKVALYLGTQCPPAGDPLVCNDDDDRCLPFGNALASIVSERVTRGQRYTVRIGGFQSEQGLGRVLVTCVPDLPACYTGQGDCCAAQSQVGCQNPECCELVCDADPTCCAVGWDADCASIAAAACTACGGGDGEICLGCIPLQSGVPYQGTTVGHTGVDLSTCDFGNPPNNPDLWHCWRADCTGTAVVSLCGSEFDTILAVFDRCDGGELACSDDACESPNVTASELRFASIAGSNYRIRVAGYDGDSGDYTLQVDCVPGPENDDCSNSKSIEDGTTAFSTIDATTDGHALPDQCSEGSGLLLGADIWFDYVASCTGVATFSTCNDADFDTRLALYQGCECPNSAEAEVVGCNDDAAGCVRTSEMTAAVEAGQCYKLRVGGFRVGDTVFTGSGNIHVSCGAAPPNDRCQDAPVESLPQTYAGTNINATHDCPEFSGGHVWIAFQLTERSNVTLDYCGSTPTFENAWLNLAKSCPCTADTSDSAAGCFICPDGNPKLQWFCLPAGTYYYPVLSEPGARGNYFIHVSSSPCTDNNACANALPLPDGETLFKTEGATTDGPALPSSCSEGGITLVQDIWFDYTASCTGTAEFSTCDLADFDTRLALYEGTACPVTNTRLRACNDDTTGCDLFTSRVSTDVTAGQTFKLRLGGTGADTSGFGCVRAACSGASCAPGSVAFLVPPDLTFDARQPTSPAGGGLQGINQFSVQAPDHTTVDCFEVQETSNGGLPGLFVMSVAPAGLGTYVVTTNRPLTPGAITTLTYTNGGISGSVIVHPGNVNGDDFANAGDIESLIACFNQPGNPGCDLYRTDTDRSGAPAPLDLLRLIDVLQGAGAIDPWLNTPNPLDG